VNQQLQFRHQFSMEGSVNAWQPTDVPCRTAGSGMPVSFATVFGIASLLLALFAAFISFHEFAKLTIVRDMQQGPAQLLSYGVSATTFLSVIWALQRPVAWVFLATGILVSIFM
jgi:hypothetical protein